MSNTKPSVMVIGAGMAGLAAARALHTAGCSVTVYDKGRGVGGRCATRRWDDATLDHGAQFFTVRDPRFQEVVDRAVADGAVVEWCRGFVRETGTSRDDGHPRYRGSPGMTAFPKWLARGLLVRTGYAVERIECNTRCVLNRGSDGGTAEADAVIVTAPVPQAEALLEAGGVPIDAEARAVLDAIAYAPCFTLMAKLRAAPMIPAPGGIQFREGGPLAWLADNAAKGISAAPSVTAHASVDFSRKYFETDPEEVQRMLMEAVVPVIGQEIVEAKIHRWRYAMPVRTAEQPCLALDTSAPIILAGDGFGGARVEGAYLSGLAAAQQLLEQHG